MRRLQGVSCLTTRLDEIATSAEATLDSKRWTKRREGTGGKLRLNRCASAAYSPATDVKGECCGKQGAEAVEPGGQEAQAKKEGSR
jgi:hypothetical protein